MTEIQQYIIDTTGADDWDAVIEAFSGGSVEEIEDTLDDILPHSDNSKLAQIIFDEVNDPDPAYADYEHAKRQWSEGWR